MRRQLVIIYQYFTRAFFLLFPLLQAFNDDLDLVFQVLPTISDAGLMADVFPVPIRSQPIIGTEAKQIGIDRHDLAVQCGQLGKGPDDQWGSLIVGPEVPWTPSRMQSSMLTDALFASSWQQARAPALANLDKIDW